MRVKEIDVNKIRGPNFGLPNDPEKDEKLTDLLTKANKGELPVFEIIADVELIKPFCSFKPDPKLLEAARPGFVADLENGTPRFLLTYQEGNNLIMSDDYYAYNLYLSEGFTRVPCVILGDTDLTDV